jgi:hypothetical protein
MLAIGISVALSAAVLAHGISTGEAADKLKAGKSSTKSDATALSSLGPCRTLSTRK